MLSSTPCTPLSPTSMLALGSCVMAMHMARPPLMQVYPSSAGRSSAVRVPPLSCVEAYMESASEDYQTSARPLDDIQPQRSTWPSARKMGSKLMSQKLHQHEEEHELEPPSGWSYHDATPAEAGGGLLSLAAKRKVFWASQTIVVSILLLVEPMLADYLALGWLRRFARRHIRGVRFNLRLKAVHGCSVQCLITVVHKRTGSPHVVRPALRGKLARMALRGCRLFLRSAHAKGSLTSRLGRRWQFNRRTQCVSSRWPPAQTVRAVAVRHVEHDTGSWLGLPAPKRAFGSVVPHLVGL